MIVQRNKGTQTHSKKMV